MAVTINASTTTGLVQTADTSGVLQLQTASTNAVTVDASQNVGIGVTPSAWFTGTSWKALQISTGGAAFTGNESTARIFFNAFVDSTGNSKYTNTGAATQYAQSAGQHIFYTAPSGTAGNAITFTERARIDSNGNFGVGRNPNGYGRIAISFSATDANNNSTGLGIDVQAATSGAKYVHFYNESGSGIGHINRNGTTNAVQYTTSSDYRLKENIQPMQGALSLISQLKPCTYDWKQECGGGVGQGFIAHELQAVVPDCVSGEKDAVETYTDEDGIEQTRPVYQGIDTSFLVATLTAAIQEQQTIINDLKARITALEGAA
jgi:hypothetical protein